MMDPVQRAIQNAAMTHSPVVKYALKAMERIAPLRLAAGFDNVGHLDMIHDPFNINYNR